MSTKIKQVRFDVFKAEVQLDGYQMDALKKIYDSIDKMDSLGKLKYHHKRKLKHLQAKRDELEEAQRYAHLGSWNIKELIDFALSQPESITMEYFDELVEIDRATIFKKDPHIIAFQMTNLRSNELPAKKKVGHQREDVRLQEDEYIGEFTQVLFDDRYNLVIVQSFRHGAGFNAISRFFNLLMKRKAEAEGDPYVKVCIGTLLPVIDPKIITELEEKNYFKKIKIRCSDLNDQTLQSSGLHGFAGAQRFVREVNGYTMDLTISFTEREKSHSLSKDEIQKAMQAYLALQGDQLSGDYAKKSARMEITYLDEAIDKYVAVDLLCPKVSFHVPVTFKERQPVNSEYLYDIVREEYSKQDSTLFRLFGGDGRIHEEGSENSST